MTTSTMSLGKKIFTHFKLMLSFSFTFTKYEVLKPAALSLTNNTSQHTFNHNSHNCKSQLTNLAIHILIPLLGI